MFNYVNIDDLDIFPTRTISSGDHEPWPVSTSLNSRKLSDTLLATLSYYNSVAYLVIKEDSIVYEQYWDGYGKDSYSNSFSMAKSYVSTLIGIAVDKGFIQNLDQPVGDYIKEFSNDDRRDISIKDLLTMSSGLNWDEGYASLFSKVTKSYYGRDLPKQMLAIEPATEPGKVWNYMSCNTQLLALILESATGMRISEFATTHLWRKIGAEHDAFWSLDQKQGTEKAYCCIYSNARDFARLGKLYKNGGTWNGVQVISESYIKAAITPAQLDFSGSGNTRYGYQWWLTNRNGYGIFYARGILGQYIFVIPDLDMIIVRLGHKRGEKNSSNELPDIEVYLDQSIEIFS
jgi:CubicO group peptidase (beta-lactamase class C family)